jgi:hypothetical protein
VPNHQPKSKVKTNVLPTVAGKKLCLAVTILGLLAATHAQAQIYLLLDFTGGSGAYTAGWNPVYGNFLADTPTAAINNIDGMGYNFSINHVGVYDNGNAAESLTRSGFYTFGDNTLDHTFTLNGVTTGDAVALYACAAWDGNGRGGVIVYGNTGPSGVQAQTIGDPGTSPTLANLTLIGTATADASGAVQGTLNGAGGVGSATEGQLGGVVFVIQSVPEPATLALAGFGIAAMFIFRRRD